MKKKTKPRPEHHEIMRNKRRMANKSLTQMSELIGTTPSMISMAERGLRPWPPHWDAIYNKYLPV